MTFVCISYGSRLKFNYVQNHYINLALTQVARFRPLAAKMVIFARAKKRSPYEFCSSLTAAGAKNTDEDVIIVSAARWKGGGGSGKGGNAIWRRRRRMFVIQGFLLFRFQQFSLRMPYVRRLHKNQR